MLTALNLRFKQVEAESIGVKLIRVGLRVTVKLPYVNSKYS